MVLFVPFRRSVPFRILYRPVCLLLSCQVQFVEEHASQSRNTVKGNYAD